MLFEEDDLFRSDLRSVLFGKDDRSCSGGKCPRHIFLIALTVDESVNTGRIYNYFGRSFLVYSCSHCSELSSHGAVKKKTFLSLDSEEFH